MQAGWGKKLTYAVGVSKDSVCDVTRRYTTRLHSLQRQLVPEQWLVSACDSLSGAGACRAFCARRSLLLHVVLSAGT